MIVSPPLNRASTPTRDTLGSTIRVFIAEDHRITLWGLQHLVESARPRMQVVGTASTRGELLNHEALASADIVILDLDLAGEDAAESINDIQRACGGHILVITGSDDLGQHRDAVMKGVRGVLHKGEPAVTILRAIEKVHAGEVWLHRALLGEVLGRLTSKVPMPSASDQHRQRIMSLTPRELEIVSAMVSLAGSKQMAVADKLGMSEHTLRNHLTTVYSKLAVRGRLEMHLYAVEHGLGALRQRRAG